MKTKQILTGLFSQTQYSLRDVPCFSCSMDPNIVRTFKTMVPWAVIFNLILVTEILYFWWVLS